MGRNVASIYLNLWLDYEPEVFVQAKDEARVWQPVTDLAGCEFRISATEQGGAIGTLTTAATHADGAPGHYVGAFDLTALRTQLPENTYPDGTEVFLQFRKSGDIDVQSFRKRIRRTQYE